MGGRGTYSYSAQHNKGAKDDSPLSAYAVASLNRGSAGGTSQEKAVDRFRQQLMDKKTEYSAYLDDSGYFHALGSSGHEGSTSVAPLTVVAKEKGVSTIVHNHPFGTSDGRKWGGPLSEGDLSYIAAAYRASSGKVNRIIATSNEGTYTAKVTRSVSEGKVKAAASRADATVKKHKYQSELAMWNAVNKAYTDEFSKIGITITYKKQSKRSSKLVTKKIGTY